MRDVRAYKLVEVGGGPVWVFSQSCDTLTWERWVERVGDPVDAMRWLRTNVPGYRLCRVGSHRNTIAVDGPDAALYGALRFYWRENARRLVTYAKVCDKNLTDVVWLECREGMYIEGIDEEVSFLPAIELLTGMARDPRSAGHKAWDSAYKRNKITNDDAVHRALDELLAALDDM